MGTDTGMVSFINDTDEMVNDGNALGWYWAFHFLQIISLLLCASEHTCMVGRVGNTDFSLEMRKLKLKSLVSCSKSSNLVVEADHYDSTCGFVIEKIHCLFIIGTNVLVTLVETDHVYHPKRDQSWVFIGRTDAKAETPILWPPHAKS